MKKIIYVLLAVASVSFAAKIHAECCWNDGCGIVLSGDVLYWKAQQKSAGYTTKPLPVYTTTDFTKSSLVSQDYRWSPGYRLAGFYNPSCQPWSVGLQYTQYCSSSSGSRRAEDLEGIFPTLSFCSDIFPEDYVTEAHSSMCLKTYLLDLVAGYDWCLCDGVVVTSTLGLRNSWITQRIHATYFGAIFSAGYDYLSLHSRSYGIGPRIGVKPSVNLGCGFALRGELAGSILYDQFDVDQDETFLTATSSLHRKNSGMRWNLDVIASLRWTYCMDCYCGIKTIYLDAGGDYLYFSRQYPFKHGSSFDLKDQGSQLALYGVHLSAGLEF